MKVFVVVVLLEFNIWWWIVFVKWLINEKCQVLFPARTTCRYSHHCRSLTCHKQDLNLCKNLSSGFIEWNGAVLITTTTLLENFKDNLDVCYLPIWDLKHFCSSLYSFVKIISSFKCNISVSTSRSRVHISAKIILVIWFVFL